MLAHRKKFKKNSKKTGNAKRSLAVAFVYRHQPKGKRLVTREKGRSFSPALSLRHSFSTAGRRVRDPVERSGADSSSHRPATTTTTLGCTETSEKRAALKALNIIENF